MNAFCNQEEQTNCIKENESEYNRIGWKFEYVKNLQWSHAKMCSSSNIFFDNHLSNILVKYAFYTVSRISLDSLSLTGLYSGGNSWREGSKLT